MSEPDVFAEFGGPGAARLSEAYLSGLAGRSPTLPYDMRSLEQAAEAVMPKQNWAYLQAAGTGATYRANLAALERLKILPAMLRGAAPRDLGVELQGRRLPAPLLLAPIGVQSLAHPEADLATARAAAARGIPMIFSNVASVAMETCAEAMGDAPRWFQLYWSWSDDLARSFVQRAEGCGCDAVVITLDTTMLGWRPSDLDAGFMPFLQHGEGIAQYTSDPVFRAMLGKPPEDDMAAAVRLFTSVVANPTLDWAHLRRIRDWTKLPILLKGILRPEDAARAAEEGWDGVIVSNHGGRQVDGAVGAMDQLGPCVDAVAGRCPVLFDSGVRTGADVFKAIAMGATAALLGRSYVWGLSLAGEAGVGAVIDNVIAEYDLTLGLSGFHRTTDVDRGAFSALRA